MEKAFKKVYVVLMGDIDDSQPETALGVFTKEKDAYDFRNGEYKSMNYIEDEDDDMGPDLNSCFIDDGSRFWHIQETRFE